MKKTIYILAVLILFGSCKQFDPKLMQPGETELKPRLPSLEKDIENNYVFIVTENGVFTGPNPQDIQTLFDKELTEKIMDPYTDKKGFCILKINTFQHRVRFGAAIFIPLIGVFTGLPTGSSSSKIEVQIDILNSNRRLIGSYKGYGETKIKSSLYKNNYMQATLSRTTYLMALRTAIQEAKNKMLPDIDRLNKELN